VTALHGQVVSVSGIPTSPELKRGNQLHSITIAQKCDAKTRHRSAKSALNVLPPVISVTPRTRLEAHRRKHESRIFFSIDSMDDFATITGSTAQHARPDDAGLGSGGSGTGSHSPITRLGVVHQIAGKSTADHSEVSTQTALERAAAAQRSRKNQPLDMTMTAMTPRTRVAMLRGFSGEETVFRAERRPLHAAGAAGRIYPQNTFPLMDELGNHSPLYNRTLGSQSPLYNSQQERRSVRFAEATDKKGSGSSRDKAMKRDTEKTHGALEIKCPLPRSDGENQMVVARETSSSKASNTNIAMILYQVMMMMFIGTETLVTPAFEVKLGLWALGFWVWVWVWALINTTTTALGFGLFGLGLGLGLGLGSEFRAQTSTF
jgi:hypothetical protein